MTVCVNSRPIREYGRRGLTFVEGRQKHPYTIKFRNNSAKRVLALFCVDGLSVMDGKPADNESRRGYIVPAYGTIEVKGWRTSLEEIHDFVFDAKKRAVSTQAEKTDANCGIVEVKVFDEKVDPNSLVQWFNTVEHHHHHHHEKIVYRDPYPYIYPIPFYPTIWCGGSMVGQASGQADSTITYSASLSSTNSLINTSSGLTDQVRSVDEPIVRSNYMCSASEPQDIPDFTLGTGWGKSQVDRVEEQKFERGVELACFAIYYSDAASLATVGIEVDKKPTVSKPVLPKGFNGFCKPPVVTSA